MQGQVKLDCAADPSCAATCTNKLSLRRCPAICVVGGCECPNGTVIDEDLRRCVPPTTCPESMIKLI